MHSCDRRACVNPDHLSIGSYSENVADMIAKDRGIKGAAHPLAKLDETSARYIKHSKGSQAALAAKFNVDKALVQRIQRGKSWRHLK